MLTLQPEYFLLAAVILSHVPVIEWQAKGAVIHGESVCISLTVAFRGK